MESRLIFSEFAASIHRAPDLRIDERLSDWTHAVKESIARAGKRRGFQPFVTDDRRKSGAFLWDVAWCEEDPRHSSRGAWGAGVEGLEFPVVPYRRLQLVAEVEWGRPGQRRRTRSWQRNIEEVFRDFYKLLDARSAHKIMVYTTWQFEGQGGEDGAFLRGFRELLLAYRGHDPNDRYLFIEFDDKEHQIRGWSTKVPARGPASFRIETVGERAYPPRWWVNP